MKSIEELKKEHKEQLAKLKAAQKTEFDRVIAANRKKEALERAAERKTENHVKFLLAGDVIAEMKRTKDVSLLEALAARLENERDKAAVSRLITSILGTPSAKPAASDAAVERATSEAAAVLPKNDTLPLLDEAGDDNEPAKEKRGFFGLGR
jgi:hypothetical protein